MRAAYLETISAVDELKKFMAPAKKFGARPRKAQKPESKHYASFRWKVK
jgi:hypothetical protein